MVIQILLGLYLKDADDYNLLKLQSIADYQLGKSLGAALFPKKLSISISRKTGRMRHVYYKGILLATLKPKDGLFALTVKGAKKLLNKPQAHRFTVVVNDEVASYIRKGRNVFAKHVIWADEYLKPTEETIVVNEKKELLAVGKACMSGLEMLSFDRGVAIKIRRGVE